MPSPSHSFTDRLQPFKNRPKWLKLLCILWLALFILLVLATTLFQLSVRPAQLALTLTAGQSAEVSVWRPFAHPASFALQFTRTPGQSRPELGEWVTPAAPAEGPAVPSLAFSKPGEPVKILVQVDGQQLSYSAMPASSSESESEGNTVERPLTPWKDDGNPETFTWPPAVSTPIAQASGQSQFRFTVQELGPRLQGEHVQLLIAPPLSFKSVQPGYGWLWPLFFWPSFAAVLAILGALLLWLCLRHRPPKAPAP